MKVFAISDLHLSLHNSKPMDIFGSAWDNYVEKIFEEWKEKVSEEDLVLLAGDFSWAMTLENTKKDFDLLATLPGKKILIRGNHDYWWKSISAVRKFLPPNFFAIQNDAIKFDKIIICGTRGWSIPEKPENSNAEDAKILKREEIRLELSLQAATKLKTSQDDKIICMIHFPPTNFKKEENAFTNLLKEYKVDAVVFGHLHGYKNIPIKYLRENTPYYLTSCDITENHLIQIEEV